MPPDQQIVFWTNRLSPDTKDYITLTHLGHAYLMQARVTGDADSYARAEEALQRALSLNERYAPAKNLLGSVYIGNHAFAKALAGAQEALQADPTNLQALAVSGDSALELGQYAEAESAFRTLLDAAPWQDGRDTAIRIHGTIEPNSIGKSVSNGCLRMVNAHVIDLYDRVALGAPVMVY